MLKIKLYLFLSRFIPYFRNKMRDSILNAIYRLVLDYSKKFEGFKSLYNISKVARPSYSSSVVTIKFRIDYKSTSINFFITCEKFPNGQYNIEKMIEPPTSSVSRGNIIEEIISIGLLCSHIEKISNETLSSHMRYLLT